MDHIELTYATITGPKAVPITEAARNQLNPHGGEALKNNGVSDLAVSVWVQLVAATKEAQASTLRSHSGVGARAVVTALTRVLASRYGMSPWFWEMEARAAIAAE